MAETIISLDAMGGDVGPDVVLAGAARCLSVRPELRFLIFGDEAIVKPKLKPHVLLRRRSKFHHCDVSVGMDDKPSQALRKGRYKSSMWRAIQAVRDGEAQLAVSAGNTGALMAMSTFCLKTMAQVGRPAIAGIWPTLRGESIMLDLGATIGASEQHLVDCSVMGGAMARALYNLDKPTIGLLNIGVEEVKGLGEIKAAGQRLRDANLPNLSYAGFVEGDDIGRGIVDVIVTEGFSGNIALKTAEGTAKQIGLYLREAMGRTWASRIGYLFARNAFTVLNKRMDPRRSNGGVFLGLNGVVIKSHGGADAEGFQAAIEIGHDMVRNQLMEKIQTDLDQYYVDQGAQQETS